MVCDITWSAPERLFICLGLGLSSQLAGQPSAKCVWCVLKLYFFLSSIHLCVCVCVCVCVYVCVCISSLMYVGTHVCLGVHVCMYMWKVDTDIECFLQLFSIYIVS